MGLLTLPLIIFIALLEGRSGRGGRNGKSDGTVVIPLESMEELITFSHDEEGIERTLTTAVFNPDTLLRITIGCIIRVGSGFHGRFLSTGVNH